jgi:cysteine-rich repeat protein
VNVSEPGSEARTIAKVFFVVVLGALGLLACSSSSSTVFVTVTKSSVVPPVTRLRLTLSTGGVSEVKVFPETAVAGPITFPASLALVLGASRVGRLDVAIDGLDEAMAIVANGALSLAVVAGAQTNGSVELHSGPSLCGNHVLDPSERCDDGNRISGDGCDYSCAVEERSDAGALSDGAVDRHDLDSAPDAGEAGGQAGNGDSGSPSSVDASLPHPDVPACPANTYLWGARCPDKYADGTICVLGCIENNAGVTFDPPGGSCFAAVPYMYQGTGICLAATATCGQCPKAVPALNP